MEYEQHYCNCAFRTLKVDICPFFFFSSSFVMDSHHHSNYKLSKTEKKFLRKQIKARHTLLRHEGIETVSHATQVTLDCYHHLNENILPC